MTRALARLDGALTRAEAAIGVLATAPRTAGNELAVLRERHQTLKDAVAAGLRQLDEVIAGMPR